MDGYADHGGAGASMTLQSFYQMQTSYSSVAGTDKNPRGSHRNTYTKPSSAVIKCDRM